MSSLVAVIPYYNFSKNKFILKNHLKQVEDLNRQGVENVTYEISNNDSFEIPDTVVCERIKTNSVMWHKEALINLAASRLPHEYIAWLDSGITLSDGWAEDTIRELRVHDFVQCFSHIYWMKNNMEIEKAQSSTMFGRLLGSPFGEGFGGAWATKRQFFKEIGIFPYNVVGGGDTIFCSGVLGVVHETLNRSRYSNVHYEMIIDWINNVKSMNMSVGFVYGQFKHLWHGPRGNRFYKERHQVLKKFDFNPLNDICFNNGVMEWNSPKLEMHSIMKYYFERRGN